jgi:hypothetical protein
MGTRLSNALSQILHGLSARTMLIGAIFMVTLVAAVCVDVDALLEYFNLVGGSPGDALELGAIITAAAAVPFLATGFSISDDQTRRNR